MSTIDHAKKELDIIGMTADDKDEMNSSMRKHIIHMVEEFSKEGHSGFSANYAIDKIVKLLKQEPLSALTGEDSEWNDVSASCSEEEGVTYQNNRCSRVFKNKKEGVYIIDGKVFWEWVTDEKTGEKHKSYYTGRGSCVKIKFPYVIPKEPIYEERKSND